MRRNKFINAIWSISRYGITGILNEANCNKYFYNQDLFEDNTFVNTLGRNATNLRI